MFIYDALHFFVGKLISDQNVHLSGCFLINKHVDLSFFPIC